MTEITVSDVNVISLVLFSHIGHLHHSHVWLPFTGLLGRILISPAHHQIHHSADPAHYNRNYGANIAIFDWMAGTLHVPSKSPEKLTFGVARDEYDPHTAVGGMLAPMVRAARLFAPEATTDRPREAVQSVPDPRT